LVAENKPIVSFVQAFLVKVAHGKSDEPARGKIAKYGLTQTSGTILVSGTLK